MEIFFNLLWVAVTASLFGAWFADTRHRMTSSLPRLGLQLIALAMLAVILLPAISLTDDLQANTQLAETEHFSRRADAHLSAEGGLHSQPLALALLVVTPPAACSVLTGSIGAEQSFFVRIESSSVACANRPPPEERFA